VATLRAAPVAQHGSICRARACLAKSDYCAVDLVDEKIAALEQIPENAAEAMRIDAIEGQESLDELVGVNGKESRLISGAGDPQHGQSLRSFLVARVTSIRDHGGVASTGNSAVAADGPEYTAPMLDVHPPHTAARTWTDFAVHLVTIVIGLLIAIGLEQTVEYVHHRGRLADARLALEAELAANSDIVDFNLAEARRIAAALDANVRALQAGREAPAPVPSGLNYTWNVRWPRDGTWQVVRQDGSLGLMPREELHRYVYLYEGVDYQMRNLDAVAQQLDRAMAISDRSALGPTTARDKEELITATTEARGRIMYLLDLLALQRASLNKFRARPDNTTASRPK
jgi:hypothetical protein